MDAPSVMSPAFVSHPILFGSMNLKSRTIVHFPEVSHPLGLNANFPTNSALALVPLRPATTAASKNFPVQWSLTRWGAVRLFDSNTNCAMQLIPPTCHARQRAPGAFQLDFSINLPDAREFGFTQSISPVIWQFGQVQFWLCIDLIKQTPSWGCMYSFPRAVDPSEVIAVADAFLRAFLGCGRRWRWGSVEVIGINDRRDGETKPLLQLDAVFHRSIRARDKRTNGERVNRQDFDSYFSSGTEIWYNKELPGWDFSRETGSIRAKTVSSVFLLYGYRDRVPCYRQLRSS
jgi:hypothetical protein